jgi:hypothetical protein
MAFFISLTIGAQLLEKNYGFNLHKLLPQQALIVLCHSQGLALLLL